VFRIFFTKNCQNLIIGFQVTVKNVGDVFLGHSVEPKERTSVLPAATGKKLGTGGGGIFFIYLYHEMLCNNIQQLMKTNRHII